MSLSVLSCDTYSNEPYVMTTSTLPDASDLQTGMQQQFLFLFDLRFRPRCHLFLGVLTSWRFVIQADRQMYTAAVHERWTSISDRVTSCR